MDDKVVIGQDESTNTELRSVLRYHVRKSASLLYHIFLESKEQSKSSRCMEG